MRLSTERLHKRRQLNPGFKLLLYIVKVNMLPRKFPSKKTENFERDYIIYLWAPQELTAQSPTLFAKHRCNDSL